MIGSRGIGLLGIMGSGVGGSRGWLRSRGGGGLRVWSQGWWGERVLVSRGGGVKGDGDPRIVGLLVVGSRE